MPVEECKLPDPALLSAYSPTENCTRWFCKTCGVHLFTQDKRMPQSVGFPAGVFADSDVLRPKANYFVDHMAVWHEHAADSVPNFGGESGYEPVRA